MLARGLQDVLGPAGYDEIITNTNGGRELERAALDKMISRQVDGVAFAVFHTHADDLQPVIDARIPVVRLGGRQVQPGVDLVHSDDEGGARRGDRYCWTMDTAGSLSSAVRAPRGRPPSGSPATGPRWAEAGVDPQQTRGAHATSAGPAARTACATADPATRSGPTRCCAPTT